MIDRRKNPPFLHEYENRHGTTVYYLRRPGHKKIRLKIPDGALPWSPRFMEVYDAAMSSAPDAPAIGASRTVAGTVNAALVSYYQATAFTSLEKSTQQTRRAELERFRTGHGDKRIALMHGTAMLIIRGNFEGALRVQTIHACLDAFDGILDAAARSKGHPQSAPKWPSNLILGEGKQSSVGNGNGGSRKRKSKGKKLRNAQSSEITG